MSVKLYKLETSTSTQKIRKARKKLKEMSKQKRIDLMVEAGIMTRRQAERAKKKLAETQV